MPRVLWSVCPFLHLPNLTDSPLLPLPVLLPSLSFFYLFCLSPSSLSQFQPQSPLPRYPFNLYPAGTSGSRWVLKEEHWTSSSTLDPQTRSSLDPPVSSKITSPSTKLLRSGNYKLGFVFPHTLESRGEHVFGVKFKIESEGGRFSHSPPAPLVHGLATSRRVSRTFSCILAPH